MVLATATVTATAGVGGIGHNGGHGYRGAVAAIVDKVDGVHCIWLWQLCVTFVEQFALQIFEEK